MIGHNIKPILGRIRRAAVPDRAGLEVVQLLAWRGGCGDGVWGGGGGAGEGEGEREGEEEVEGEGEGEGDVHLCVWCGLWVWKLRSEI